MQQLINDLAAMLSGGAFTTYIDYIRFPRFRNLEKDCRIDFNFPYTALVGQNGSGKSSTLQALYGAPHFKNVGNYWFSTEVDPIKELEDGRPHCLIYGYKNDQGRQVEVLKTRIQKKTNPDYWEPSRPVLEYGMEMMAGARNPAIKMEVVYIDFRSILSAYDKYFYFRKPINLRSKTKQDYLRLKSKNLHNVIETKEIQRSGGSVQNQRPVKLTDDELKNISSILGKNYVSGMVIEHKFFQEWGTSVVYTTDNLKYSEAFAGSGEIAVVELVHQIHLAPEHSLVLLDEPDVSLHPGAQNKMKTFLLEQIKKKKIQVVISTHSPALIAGLPSSAIKVFTNNSDGKVHVVPGRKPEEAFFSVGQPNESLKNIVVEDVLAKDMVEAVLKGMGEDVASQFEVQYYPGGAQSICKDCTVYCRRSSSKMFILFDGDRKPTADAVDVADLTDREKTIDNLNSIIELQAGCKVTFYADGGTAGRNRSQTKNMMLDFLRFWKSNVFYLASAKPEDALWDDAQAQTQFNSLGLGIDEIDGYMTQLAALISTKDKFVTFAGHFYADRNPDYIKQAHNLFLAHWKRKKDANYQALEQVLESIRGL